MIFELIFWTCLVIMVYHIIFFAPILWLINRLSSKKAPQTIDSIKDENLPTVTVICPAYNEEKNIEQKIKSFLSLNYPKDKIKMIVISDASTDNTNDLVLKYQSENVLLLVQTSRQGKQYAQNFALPYINSELVLSTDADAIFHPDSVRLLVEKMYSEPKIGIVCGGLKVIKESQSDSGENNYLRFEHFVRKTISDFFSLIVVSGALYLIRKELFQLINPHSADDFERPLYVLKQGYKVKYEPRAQVKVTLPETTYEEISRKIRIITQEWFVLRRYTSLLNPFKHFKISFLLFSHKLIRWFFFLFSILMMISCLMISKSIYLYLFLCQFLFFLLGSIILILQKRGAHLDLPFAGFPTYLTAMCYASLVAFFHFITNKNQGIWNPIRK